MEKQTKNIAVLILNWNGVKLLQKYLPYVVKYNSSEAEIIIVDNASDDNSILFLQNTFPNLKRIEFKENYGFARGYNKAVNLVPHKYVVLLNSDVRVTKNWLKDPIEFLNSNADYAACQPKILDDNTPLKFEYAGASGGYIDTLGYPFCRGRIFDCLEEDKGQYNDSKEIFWATGACLFVRASHFFEVGGFDEDFFAHQEEIDLCWRLKNKKYKIFVEPKSKVYHVGGGTLNVGSPFKTFLNFRNNLYMLFKNLPLRNLFTIISVRLVLDGIASLTFLNKKKGIKHLIAVIKAHFYFYIEIPKLIRKRRKISQRSSLVGKTNYSILLKNKVMRIKNFSEL